METDGGGCEKKIALRLIYFHIFNKKVTFDHGLWQLVHLFFISNDVSAQFEYNLSVLRLIFRLQVILMKCISFHKILNAVLR